MKSLSLICFAGLIVLSSCTEDIDIIDERTAVPVVYSVIDPYDTVHYVRVQRLFEIQKKSDWDALTADSMQFDDVEVLLHGKRDADTLWTELLTEVETVKECGFFPVEGSQSFILSKKLPYEHGDPDHDSLVLEVRIRDLGIVTKASTPVLNPVEIPNYKSRFTLYVYGSYPSVFALSSTGERRTGDYSEGYLQIQFRVHIKEYYADSIVARDLFWSTHEGFDDGAYFIRPTTFFNPLVSYLEDDIKILARALDSVDVALIKPCKFFDDYWSIREYWEDSDNPPYTNFDNSFGMFFSIGKDEWTGMKLFFQAMDSLCEGDSYKQYKFRR